MARVGTNTRTRSARRTLREVVSPQPPPPATIGVFEIPSDGSLKELHEHIDMVYFTRPRSLALPETDGWRWVDAATLRDNVALTPPDGGEAATRRRCAGLRLAAIAAAE